MNATEVVRIVDLDGLFIESKTGREELKFRIEIWRPLAAKRPKSPCPRFIARIFRLDTFRITPSFPQKNGKLTSEAADCEMFVMDDAFSIEEISGKSAQLTLDTALKALQSRFGGV